jgi:hypothetical protein
LAFKNLTFGGKVEGKSLFSFGANEASYKALQSAAAGDVYDIEVVKNPAGFNDWVSAKKSDGVTSPSSTGGATNSSPAKVSAYTASPKSTYETPEERAVKQVYIVRQSNLSTAVAALSVGAKTAPTPEAIIDMAKRFEEHVFGSTKDEVESGTDGFADLDTMDDMPQ